MSHPHQYAIDELKKKGEAAKTKPYDQCSHEELVGLMLNDQALEHSLHANSENARRAATGGPFRPNPPYDPNAPVKPRPILDAFKKFILDGMTQYGPQIIALIGPLIQKWLNGATTGTAAHEFPVLVEGGGGARYPGESGADMAQRGAPVNQLQTGVQTRQLSPEESGMEPGRKSSPFDAPGHDQQKLNDEETMALSQPSFEQQQHADTLKKDAEMGVALNEFNERQAEQEKEQNLQAQRENAAENMPKANPEAPKK